MLRLKRKVKEEVKHKNDMVIVRINTFSLQNVL